jgi:hypothetical protein
MIAYQPMRAAILAAVTFCSCSGDSTASVAGFAHAYAQALCSRAATCCTPDDFQSAMGGSLATCESDLRSKYENGAKLVQAGIRRYDPAAGAECIEKVQSASCAEVFPAAPNAADPCSRFLVGARPVGSVCDGDYYCASNDCESQRCVTPPCTTGSCPAGQYCVGNTGCATLVEQGGACTSQGMCGSQGVCDGKICVPLFEDGVACTYNRQCRSGTCGSFPGSTDKTCRQPYCWGS